MKRPQQESSDSDSSSFLFAADPNDSEADAPKSLFSEDAEEKPVKPTKRARKSPKPEKPSETDSPKNESPSLTLEPLQEAKEGVPTRPSDSDKSDKKEEEPQLRETTTEENTITSERPNIDVPPQIEVNKETPDPSTKNKPVKPEQSSQESSVAPSESRPSAYQVVARRYRPQAFDELIGQETVARALSNAIETDRVGHAYLFTGARGVGKTSCARIFAKALNCVEGPTTHPCLKCDSCVCIATGDDVDVIEIDGASNRGVDEIRQLRQNAMIAPTRSLYKIYIIDEVHMLTREAFNALLKTLEEPPARVKFIFCTTEPNKIPVTILSRCQRFDFNGINGRSIADRLAQIAGQEGAKAEEGVFEILARRANGSMRDAQSLLEQLLSFAPEYISQNDVHKMLGSVDDKKIFELLEATAQGDAARAFELLNESANQGVDFGVLIEQTLGVYRDLMVVGVGCGANELNYSPAARLPELQKTAHNLGMRRILASLQILDQTAQRMRVSAQARILAELAFARLCQLDSFQALESLITQIKQGAFPNVPLSLPSSSLEEKDDQKKNNAVVSKPASVVCESPYKAESIKKPEEAPDKNDEKSENGVDRSAWRGQSQFTPEAPESKEEAQTYAETDESLKTESNVSVNSPWLSLSPEQLANIWLDTTNFGVVLPGQASAFCSVRTEAPNQFIVSFPGGCSSQRDYCESEKGKIVNRLSDILGERVDLRCIIDSTVVATSTAAANGYTPVSFGNPAPQANDVSERYVPSSSFRESSNSSRNVPKRERAVNFQEVSRQLDKNEAVQQLKELFEAELSEVKKTPDPQTSKFGFFN